MKLDYLKERKGLVSVVLLGTSAFMGAVTLVKATAFFVSSARAERLVEQAIAQAEPDAEDVQKYLAQSKAIADELKRKNLFAPPEPKQQPIKQVWGILGDEVLIDGSDKWYKVGDMVQDAKIVAIEPTQVKIQWDGREIVLAPIEAASSAGPEGPRRGGVGVAARAGGAEGDRAEMVVVRSEGGPMPDRGGRGGFGGFSPQGGGFDGMRERLQNMSEADRDRFRREMEQRREQFMSMSPEQRQRLVEGLRDRFGGGGLGRGPGGGSARGPGGGSARGPGGGRGSSGRR